MEVKANENIRFFEDEWGLIQEGGKSEYPSVNKLIQKYSADTVGNELSQEALEAINFELQKQIFGKIIYKKPMSASLKGKTMAIKNLKVGESVTAAPMHPKDDLLGGITYEDLIMTVQSNEKDHSPKTIEKVFRELMSMHQKDAEHSLKQNMNFIMQGLR